MEKLFLAGLGGAIMAKEHVEQTINQLVNKGDLTREQAKSMVDDLQSRADSEKNKLENRGKEELRKFFAEHNIAFTEDIKRLENRLAALEAKLEALTPKETAEA